METTLRRRCVSTKITNPNFAFQGPAQTPTKGLNKSKSDWESRAHLKFDAVMGKELSGTIFFEIDTFRYGAAFGGYPGIGREANNFGAWTTDRTAVEVKNIYIDFGLPYFGIPVPVTLRVGAQPLASGQTCWYIRMVRVSQGASSLTR